LRLVALRRFFGVLTVGTIRKVIMTTEEFLEDELVAAIWQAMDATGGDADAVQDAVDQALHTWSPQDDTGDMEEDPLEGA
jgi:hypothetical protein